MTVYFVYRSSDRGPSGKHHVRFPHDTVLDWFREHIFNWRDDDLGSIQTSLSALLGCPSFSLAEVFLLHYPTRVYSPQTHEELVGDFEEVIDEDFSSSSIHELQMIAEEETGEAILYFFDDHYRQRFTALTSFLLYQNWRLPALDSSPRREEPTFESRQRLERLRPPATGEGATYGVVLTEDSGSHLIENLRPGFLVPGVRLPELGRHLLRSSTPEQDWPDELRSLTALLGSIPNEIEPMRKAFLESIHADPDDKVTWAAWTDWELDNTGDSPGIVLLRSAFERLSRYPAPALWELPGGGDRATLVNKLTRLERKYRHKLIESPVTVFHVEEHLAQISLHESKDPDDPFFYQWIFFDDLWAAAHPALADSLLRYSDNWDMLPPFDSDPSPP